MADPAPAAGAVGDAAADENARAILGDIIKRLWDAVGQSPDLAERRELLAFIGRVMGVRALFEGGGLRCSG
jgi:hypothetical protein